MRLSAIVLVYCLIASQAIAEPVPGTSVDLKPPSGFVKTDRFAGFGKEDTYSSIVVTEMPAPYADAIAALSTPKSLQAQGMKLLSNTPGKVDGKPATLLQIEQSPYGIQFCKWILVVDRSGATTMIAAAYPVAEAPQQEAPLKAALLGATFGEQSDPVAALPFTVTPVAPFEVAKVMGRNLALTPKGEFPVKSAAMPLMMVGLSTSKETLVPDKKVFAERRLAETATLKNVVIVETTPVRIGDLDGFSTVATATSEDGATPLTAYQVVLFDAGGYCLMQGITPTARKEEYHPAFAKMAQSFALKKAAGQSAQPAK